MNAARLALARRFAQAHHATCELVGMEALPAHTREDHVHSALAFFDADPELARALDLGLRLIKTGYVDEHVVTFTETSYGLEHPIACRPNLAGCMYQEWLASQPAPDEDPGRYRMTWPTGGPKYASMDAGR
jgi:hypothetical protein